MPANFVMLAAVSFIACLLFTPLVRKIATGLGIVAKPNPVVKTHVSAIPFLGGIAVYFAFITGIIASGIIDEYLVLILCIGLMVALGLYDDIKPLSAMQKLIGQIIISFFSLWILTGTNGENLSLVQFALLVSWLVLTTNALNLIDVMDGLATGISAIAFLGLSAVAIFYGFDNLAAFSLAFTAALFGFLPFNLYRAKIFLGDAGSLMIGFSFGLLTLLVPQFKMPSEITAIALLLFAVPIFELVFLFVMRSLKGKPFWQGSRDHFSLRLLALGWSVPLIVGISYAAAVFLMIVAVGIAGLQDTSLKWLSIVPVAAFVLIAWKRLSAIKVQTL